MVVSFLQAKLCSASYRCLSSFVAGRLESQHQAHQFGAARKPLEVKSPVQSAHLEAQLGKPLHTNSVPVEILSRLESSMPCDTCWRHSNRSEHLNSPIPRLTYTGGNATPAKNYYQDMKFDDDWPLNNE